MHDHDEIREWMRRAKLVLGFTKYDPLSKITGIGENKLSKMLGKNWRQGIPPSAVIAVANHLKSMGLYDKCPLPGDESHNALHDDPMIIRRIEEESDRGYSRDKYEPKIPGAVPELDVAAGAGEGNVGEFVQININGETWAGHKVIAEWKFPDGYLQNSMNSAPRDTIVIEVIGDSMDPTIRHKDKVIVDLSVNAIGTDGIYLISDGFRAPQVKRLTYVWKSNPPSVVVSSDNPSQRETQTMVLDEEIFIVGRISGRVTAT